MGLFTIGYNFSTYTPSAANNDTSYPIINLYAYANTKRHTRMLSATASLIVLDQGTTHTLSGIVINDVNFATCIIMGNASSDFATPSFSTQISIPLDDRVGRRKVYHPLSGDYRYIGINLPNAMTITDSNLVYRIGSIALISTFLNTKPADYEYSAEEALESESFKSGANPCVKMGDAIWEGILTYNPSDSSSEEKDLGTLNAIDRTQPIAIFEGDTSDYSKVYICRRKTAVSIRREPGSLFTPGAITFRELLYG